MADNKRTCTFDGCERPYSALGCCIAHYKQLWRGVPLTPIIRRAKLGMPLSERLDMYTDKSGDCWLWMATKSLDGYGHIWIGDRHVGAHRAAYELAYGAIPEGLQIDHKCHTTSCVNPAHLRACTQKQNLENLNGARANSKSGVRGVSWDRNASKWRCKVTHNRQELHIGMFATIEEAEAAIIAKRNELFTHNDADRV